jgi:predicted nucleotidyltransferase
MYEQEMAKRNLILKVMVGSHLYGTETENSDKDYVGVFIPDKEYVLGLKECEQVEQRTNPSDSGHRNDKDDTDCTLYSLPKFIKLCAENNPNIIEILFANKNHIIHCNTYGEALIQNAPLFVSKKVKHRFLGYANSQKQKLLFKQAEGGRVEYYEKFGYDVKFASHLIRLLTEGLELLVDGRLSFPITHNRLVRDIKLGKFTMDQVLAKADQFEALVEEAYVKSTLPYSPNYDEISKLQMRLLERYWKSQENIVRTI